MANNKNFIAKNGVSTGDGYSMPDVRPSLLLDFANSKTLDPRITFTRGSTATYWDGKTTTKAEENFFTYSQAVATNWTNFSSRFTVTTGITAPDGTSTALQLANSSGTTAYFYQDIGFSLSIGTTYTISFYVKSNTGSSETINIMLPSTGQSNTATATTSWTRVSWSPTLGISNSFGGLFVADGVDISVWGFQLEQRSSATAYTATTSSPIVKYQPTLQTAASGEARFDHDPVTGESKGLLIEESRTNLANWSEVASNFYSGNLSDQMYDNAGIAPDGTHTADLVHESSINEHQSVYGLIGGISASTTYTRSCHFKSRGSRYICLQQYDGVTNYATTYDLQEGAVVATQGSATGTIEDIGNGWFRCSQTFTTASNSNGAERIQIGIPTGANATIQQLGDGWSGVLFWGWQLEAGSFPTSYIPTSGSTVTRSSDRANMSLSGVYSSGPVSMYVEAAEAGDVDYARLVLLSDGTNDNRMQVTISESSGYIQSFVETSDLAVAQINVNFDPAYKTFFKAAAAYDRNDFAVTAGGLTVGTDTFGNTPTVTHMYLGSLNDADADSGATFKKVALYPTRLSNATLQAMTEE